MGELVVVAFPLSRDGHLNACFHGCTTQRARELSAGSLTCCTEHID